MQDFYMNCFIEKARHMPGDQTKLVESGSIAYAASWLEFAGVAHRGENVVAFDGVEDEPNTSD
jgi:hypothetical protein